MKLHNILCRCCWFEISKSRKLSVQGEGGVRQTEMLTAEPFCQSLASLRLRLLLAWEGNLHFEVHKLIKLIWNKEELPHSGRYQLSYLFTKMVIRLTAVVIEAYHCCQLHSEFYPTFFFLG
jgi:hypothetical protein